MIRRIKAACSAFRDPWLVQEAKDLRKEISDLNVNNEFAILLGLDAGGWIVPLVKRLNLQDRKCIRRILDRPKVKCNHIVGFDGIEDIAEIMRADSTRGMKPYDYWKFCPECGEMITQGEDG